MESQSRLQLNLESQTYMKIIFFISLAVISISIGCTNKPFQPIPPMFKTWSKPGANTEEVKNTLIECGFENIGTGFDVNDMRTGKISRNEYVAAEICMEKKGYSNTSGKSSCSYKFNLHLPACNTN